MNSYRTRVLRFLYTLKISYCNLNRKYNRCLVLNCIQDIREAAKAVNNGLMRLIGPEDDQDPSAYPPSEKQPHSETDENEANEKLETKPE